MGSDSMFVPPMIAYFINHNTSLDYTIAGEKVYTEKVIQTDSGGKRAET
jgi:hypothetical protein